MKFLSFILPASFALIPSDFRVPFVRLSGNAGIQAHESTRTFDDELGPPVILDSTMFALNHTENVNVSNRELIIYGEDDEFVTINLTRSFEFYYMLGRFPVLNVGMGSEFGSIVGSMLLFPRISGGRREMILRPSNPTSYCSSGEFLYVNHHVAISQRSRIPVTGILASVELVRANQEPIETVSPTTTTYDVFTFSNDELGYSTLPDSKFDSIVGIIENLGGQVDMSSGYVNVMMSDCFDELINMLPNIRYRLAHEIDGVIVPVIDIILESNEFVKLTSNPALCELKIEPERHFGAFRIDPVVSIGMSVFYDYQNNRFGLCDATD